MPVPRRSTEPGRPHHLVKNFRVHRLISTQVRGLLYAFLGVIALPGAAADAATNETRVTMKQGELVCVPGEAAKALEKYRVVAASAVIATGALYVLLGLCCCRGIRRGAQLRYRRRLAHAELQRAYLAERAHRTGTPVAEA
jgi:hypothetical protein